jgi:hypothetical protein
LFNHQLWQQKVIQEEYNLPYYLAQNNQLYNCYTKKVDKKAWFGISTTG